MSEAERKVVIAGGSGFLGQSLARSLVKDGIEVVVLGRAEKRGGVGRFVSWDARSEGPWREEMEGAIALINLTGRSVDCRHTQRNKDLILNSRVDSTKALGRAIQSCECPPLLWLNASTAAVYRDCRGDCSANDEDSEDDAEGFPEEVGRVWEKAFFDSERLGVRKVAMRIGVVLGEGGGAFPVMRRLARLGLGGRQGPGTQWISWLHLDDWVGIAKFLLSNPKVSGPVNLASPFPVTNCEFMRVMRERYAPLGIGLPAPSWAIHLGAILLGTAPELVLKSSKVISSKLSHAGYEFRHPRIEEAVRSLGHA